MKIKIDVDCTPEEARAFFGLPDVGPMQAAVMGEVEKRMMESLKASDPETLFKTWLPASLQGWETIQKMFWSQMAASIPGGKPARGNPGSGSPSGSSPKEKP